MALSHRRLQYLVPAVMTERTTSKILIVDDDEGVTQTFARMLRLEGYQVRTAVSAEKADNPGKSNLWLWSGPIP